MSQLTPHKVVILETSRNRRDYIRSIVSGCGGVPIIFEKEAICLDNLRPLKPDLVISGPLSLDRMCRFVNTVKMMDGSLPVLILSGDRSIQDFASFNGYRDIKVLKVNFEPSELKTAISNLILWRQTDNAGCDQDNSLIVGNSHEMLRIKKSISELCSSSEPVLIQGEPGSGKELVARAIHHQSEQRASPFVKINLAEVNSALLDEVLFDSGSGYFVNSNQHFQGLGNPADGGTLFLDEIATLPVSLQPRLLAFFENGFLISDHDADKNPELKIVVSSSKFLDRLVKEGKFREDLYYRINAITLEIPPLRERISDIPLLADFFADQFCLEHGVGHIELPKKLKDSFCRYSWPGNVRELKNVVRKTILYANRDNPFQNLAANSEKSPDAMESDQYIYAMVDPSSLKNYLKSHSNLTLKKVRRIYLLRAEKKIIKKALEKTNWNRKKAAELLEISYKSLLNKVKEYQLAD